MNYLSLREIEEKAKEQRAELRESLKKYLSASIVDMCNLHKLPIPSGEMDLITDPAIKNILDLADGFSIN